MDSTIELKQEVYYIKPHRIISRIIGLLSFCGLWEDDNQFIVIKLMKRLVYFVISLSFCVSLFSGSYMSDDYNESFFLTAAGIGGILQFVKLIYVLNKKDQIASFLNDICFHSLSDLDEFNEIQEKLNNFAKFGYANILITTIGVLAFHIVTLPIFSTEVALPLSIEFPLDWKNNRINYWLAHSFIAIGIVIAAIAYFFTMVYWYIMFNCSIKYKILGNQFRKLGQSTSPTNVCKIENSPKETEESFSQRFIELVKIHQNIQKYFFFVRLTFVNVINISIIFLQHNIQR